MDKQKISIQHFDDQYHTYLEILTWYRSEIGWYFDSGENTIHTVPFILTCAAALECSLNDYIIKHFTDNFGNHGKSQVPRLLSMALKGKLINVVPLLTSNKYIINSDHKIYQSLVELIKIRNRLVHNKSSFETHDGFIEKNDNSDNSIAIPESLKNKLSNKIDPTLGVSGDIGRFHDSLEKLHALFFDIYTDDKFYGNELIIKMEDGNPAIDFNLIIKD